MAEKISDAGMREVTLEEVKLKRVQERIAEKRFEEAQQASLNDPALRSRALIEVVRAALREGQRESVALWLERAREEARRAKPTGRRAECLFEIAGLYAEWDRPRAFSLVLEAIHAAHEAKPEEVPDVRDPRFGGRIYMPGKLSLLYRMDVEEMDFPADLLLLVREDPQGVQLAASRFRSPILRLRFLLLVARGVVEEIVGRGASSP